MDIKQDIYFQADYGKLYEEAEQGKCIRWKYDGAEGRISHLFILREIPIECDNGPWFDIVTPYGYGGPVIEKLSVGYNKKDLTAAFENSFLEYCIDNKIVSEFVRFHPIAENAKDFEDIYHAECIRHTVGTRLSEFDDPIEAEFSKGCRKRIRQAIRKGIRWRVTAQPENIEPFKDIYYSTMERNDAEEYYYFTDRYFSDCLKLFRENILFVEAIYEGKTIAAGLYFTFGKLIHIHLSGTLSEYLYLSPAYILRYAVTLWGMENGYELIHHGGGRSNRTDDSLYMFKKQFGKNTEFDFYIGKRIWNNEIYRALCRKRNKEMNGKGYFPEYREN